MNEYKLCRDCKHWEPPRGTTSRNRLVGKCKAAEMIGDHEKWGEDELVYLDSEAKMYVADGSDYFAELLTRPEFGCVEWEAKS